MSDPGHIRGRTSTTVDERRAAEEPAVLKPAATGCLSIDGRSPPGGAAFRESVQALYRVAYRMKFDARRRGKDFPVPALEGLYWGPGPATRGPPGPIRWRLIVRVPGFVRPSAVPRAVRALRAGGRVGPLDRVRLRRLAEGTCVQALHVGPYDAERPTIARIAAYADAAGLALRGPQHEIYLNDPRRVAPQRLRTILRYPARRRRAPSRVGPG